MKALLLDGPGPLDALYVDEIEKPQPKSDEVLIRVACVGLNPVDYKLAASGFSDWRYPFILGLDVAGTIEAVGDDVKEWKIGDTVFYHGNLALPGGYAEFTTVPAHILATKPEGISFAEAAAIPCAGFTAYQILTRKIPTRTAQSVLVHGGAGGVGGFAVQIGQCLDLEVIVTCSENNATYVCELGATHVIDYKNEDVASRIDDITGGRGIDIVIDTVGSENATNSLDLLAFGGHLACVAGLPDFSRIKPFTRAISIHESALGGAHLSGDRKAQEDLAAMGREMAELVVKKKISSMLAETVILEEVPAALKRLSQRHVRGKIVATVSR